MQSHASILAGASIGRANPSDLSSLWMEGKLKPACLLMLASKTWTCSFCWTYQAHRSGTQPSQQKPSSISSSQGAQALKLLNSHIYQTVGAGWRTLTSPLWDSWIVLFFNTPWYSTQACLYLLTLTLPVMLAEVPCSWQTLPIRFLHLNGYG